MGNFFNIDAPIWVFMGEVTDYIILAILWFISCLGIVTIGAATTAVYYVIGKKVRKETNRVFSDYVKSFKQNFKQSIPLTLMLIVGLISTLCYVLLILEGGFENDTSLGFKIFIPLAALFVFELVNFFTYVWAILSHFNMSNKEIIKFAFFLMHKHLGTTLLITGVYIGTIVLSYHFFPLIVGAPAIIVGGTSYLLQRLFDLYTKE